jgi:hypothetical protein
MRRRSELAMPCTRAVGCFVVPAQPPGTYLGRTFVQSHHQRHRVDGQVTLQMTLVTCRLRCAVSVKLRLGALQGCGWLRSLADSLISDMQQAILATDISHADAFRARRLCAAIGATDDSSTPCLVVIAVVAFSEHLSCSSDLPRCLLRRRATWYASTKPPTLTHLTSVPPGHRLSATVAMPCQTAAPTVAHHHHLARPRRLAMGPSSTCRPTVTQKAPTPRARDCVVLRPAESFPSCVPLSPWSR